MAHLSSSAVKQIDIDGTLLKVAVASGMRNAKVLLDQIKEGKSPYAFIEIIGCPGGCVNGGGQPFVKPVFLPNEENNILDTYREKRANALYFEDERQVLRQSHNNSQIKKLYDEYLGNQILIRLMNYYIQHIILDRDSQKSNIFIE